ncbi:MAG: hypothetical protein ABF315_04005, partial [Lentimonas sp.]
MKNYMNPTFILAGAMLTASSYLSAGDTVPVATDPVGYMSTTAADGSDTFIGAALTEQLALVSAASGVTGAFVSTASTLVADSYNNTHYVLFTTGAQAGQWYEVVDTLVNSVELDTDVAALGVTTADEFKIVEFWT